MEVVELQLLVRVAEQPRRRADAVTADQAVRLEREGAERAEEDDAQGSQEERSGQVGGGRCFGIGEHPSRQLRGEHPVRRDPAVGRFAERLHSGHVPDRATAGPRAPVLRAPTPGTPLQLSW